MPVRRRPWGDQLGEADREEGVDNRVVAQDRATAVREFLRSHYQISRFDVVNMETPAESRAGSEEAALKQRKADVDEQVKAVINNGGPQTVVVILRHAKSSGIAH